MKTGVRRGLSLLLQSSLAIALPFLPSLNLDGSSISPQLFESLEELARIVDISYCVGSTGIWKPFRCAGRCSEFEGFELVEQWKTGMLMSDSCGYVALSHPPFEKRIIVAFRGTYSIANTVVDLSTIPAEYVPYPSDDDDDPCITTSKTGTAQRPLGKVMIQESSRISVVEDEQPCQNCTVHAGFHRAWRNTRCIIIPSIELAMMRYPDYQLTLVGHSLGGAVAALAALEFEARGWDPRVTTFGEPRVGNQALVAHINERFHMTKGMAEEQTFRRVTHVADPVPLLPLEEWGYKMHSGEIFISKKDLSPARTDLHHCKGDEDGKCIAGTDKTDGEDDESHGGQASIYERFRALAENSTTVEDIENMKWSVPDRFRLWELFFAHRDYFWRLGLCLPGGDPKDWWRSPYDHGQDNQTAT